MEIVEAKNTPIYIYGEARSWKTGMALRTMLQIVAKLPVIGTDNIGRYNNRVTLVGCEEPLSETINRLVKIGGFKNKEEAWAFLSARGIKLHGYFLGAKNIDDVLASMASMDSVGDTDNHIVIFENIGSMSDVDKTWKAAFEYAEKPATTVIVTETFVPGRLYPVREERFNVTIHMREWRDGLPPSYTVHASATDWDGLFLNLSGK